jgi:hypothetical protein
MGSREELLRRLPEGFLKITARKPAGAAKLAESERVALIRKGNELYNLKKYELARKIFVTTGYADGLIRLGDLYLKHSQPLEAFRMFLLAPDSKRVQAMVEKSVAVLRHWLSEDKPAAPMPAAPAPGAPAPMPAAPAPAPGASAPKAEATPKAAAAPGASAPKAAAAPKAPNPTAAPRPAPK